MSEPIYTDRDYLDRRFNGIEDKVDKLVTAWYGSPGAPGFDIRLNILEQRDYARERAARTRWKAARIALTAVSIGLAVAKLAGIA